MRLLILLLLAPTTVAAQGLVHPPHPPPPGERGSENISVVAHLPLGMPGSVSDIEVEQDEGRPFAYVGRRLYEKGFDIVDLSDPQRARVIHRWRIENEDLHQGGAMDGRYFKHEGRYFYMQSVQFGQAVPTLMSAQIIF